MISMINIDFQYHSIEIDKKKLISINIDDFPIEIDNDFLSIIIDDFDFYRFSIWIDINRGII